jgi:hypothetical protein
MVYTNPENAATNTYAIAEVTDDEAISIQPLGEESLKNGNQFIFRETFDRDTTDSNLKILIHQPSTADNRLRVIGLIIGSNKALEGTMSFNVDVESEGTDFRYANARVTDPMPESENLNVQYGGTYTKGAGGQADALPVEVLETGTGINRRAMDSSRSAFRLTPGTNILYDLEAQSDGTDIIVEFIVSERPEA